MHARTQIRDAVKTRLTGLLMTGTKVHTSRVTPFDRATELPCINIHISDEEFDRGAEANEMGAVQVRAIEIVIEGRIAAADAGPIDDDMDELALQIEKAMVSDLTLGGKLWLNEYAGTALELDDETESVTGIVTLNYAAAYRVNAADPETII